MIDWQPIETMPEAEHILLHWKNGERGVGGIECATVFIIDGEYNYWTHGGPNSGSDWYVRDNEKPNAWAKLPEGPKW